MYGMATTLRTNRATQIKNAIDAAATAGYLEIWSGARPATGAAGAGTKLGTLTFSDPCGTVTNGVLAFAAITEDVAADANGTATWFRIYDGDATFVMDGSITAIGGGGDMEMNTTTIIAGGPISITTTRSITEGNA